MEIARRHHLYVIEDACQAIGSEYHSTDGSIKKAGTIGNIGCTSFSQVKILVVMVMEGQSLQMMTSLQIC